MTTAVRNARDQTLGHLPINRLGLWLFLVSDASFFIALISSRFFVVRLETPDEVSQVLGLSLTILLLLSSLTAYRAEVSAAHGDQVWFRRYIIATILMGIAFLGGVGYEWQQAYTHFPPHTGYGSILFTLTGVHATHVLSGIALLAIVYFKGLGGKYGPEDYWGVEGAVKWWHFVDVAWVFIYPTLYLVNT